MSATVHVGKGTQALDEQNITNCIVYTPIEPTRKEIRVLDVTPGTRNAIVEAQVRHISLLTDPVPVYEEISYC